jgi:hypothetical protein
MIFTIHLSLLAFNFRDTYILMAINFTSRRTMTLAERAMGSKGMSVAHILETVAIHRHRWHRLAHIHLDTVKSTMLPLPSQPM